MQQVMTAEARASLTMTSRQIAELTGKNHADVMRDIRRMLEQLGLSNFAESSYVNSQNRVMPMYELDEEHTLCLTSGYSVTQRMAIIKEWKALKEQAAVVALPNFNNPVEAARAWANEVEAKQVALVALEQAKPAVEFVERYTNSDGLFGFREAAKKLGMGEKKLVNLMLETGHVYRLAGKLVPSSKSLTTQRFEMVTGQKGDIAYMQTKFTPKGIQWAFGLAMKANLI